MKDRISYLPTCVFSTTTINKIYHIESSIHLDSFYQFLYWPTFNFRMCVCRKTVRKSFLKCYIKNPFPMSFRMWYSFTREKKINGNRNLVGQFKVSEMILLIKEGSNDFLQTLCINFFLDAFSNILIAIITIHYYRKIDGSSNLVDPGVCR